MVTWNLKSCPRCGGDIFLDTNLDVWYEHCLQCGYRRYIPSIVEVRHRSEMKNKNELIRQRK